MSSFLLTYVEFGRVIQVLQDNFTFRLRSTELSEQFFFVSTHDVKEKYYVVSIDLLKFRGIDLR